MTDPFTVDSFIGVENVIWMIAVVRTWRLSLAGTVETIIGPARGSGPRLGPEPKVNPPTVNPTRSRTDVSLQLRTANEALGIGGFHHGPAVRARDELFPTFRAARLLAGLGGGLLFRRALLFCGRSLRRLGAPWGRRCRSASPHQQEAHDEQGDHDDRDQDVEPHTAAALGRGLL